VLDDRRFSEYTVVIIIHTYNARFDVLCCGVAKLSEIQRQSISFILVLGDSFTIRPTTRAGRRPST
jgi:hypothetical protein